MIRYDVSGQDSISYLEHARRAQRNGALGLVLGHPDLNFQQVERLHGGKAVLHASDDEMEQMHRRSEIINIPVIMVTNFKEIEQAVSCVSHLSSGPTSCDRMASFAHQSPVAMRRCACVGAERRPCKGRGHS